MFSDGKSFSSFSLKVLYNFAEDTLTSLQAGVTVSSRNFKKAVDRNKVKRLIREAYRLQKLPLQKLITEQNRSLALFFIYTGKQLPTLDELHKSMQILLQRLMENLKQNN